MMLEPVARNFCSVPSGTGNPIQPTTPNHAAEYRHRPEWSTTSVSLQRVRHLTTREQRTGQALSISCAKDLQVFDAPLLRHGMLPPASTPTLNDRSEAGRRRSRDPGTHGEDISGHTSFLNTSLPSCAKTSTDQQSRRRGTEVL
jgi:hypothetical protein